MGCGPNLIEDGAFGAFGIAPGFVRSVKREDSSKQLAKDRYRIEERRFQAGVLEICLAMSVWGRRWPGSNENRRAPSAFLAPEV